MRMPPARPGTGGQRRPSGRYSPSRQQDTGPKPGGATRPLAGLDCGPHQPGNAMHYVYLGIAIVAEVIATSSLKAAAEFTRPIPSIIVVIGYAVAFYCLSLSLRVIPVGIAYAIWSAL